MQELTTAQLGGVLLALRHLQSDLYKGRKIPDALDFVPSGRIDPLAIDTICESANCDGLHFGVST